MGPCFSCGGVMVRRVTRSGVRVRCAGCGKSFVPRGTGRRRRSSPRGYKSYGRRRGRY